MELKFGQLIEGEAHRDAVHVAVTPMTAYHTLQPGWHVGIVKEGIAGTGVELIGIVDPYLKVPVRKGQKFWLFLYPNTVTGMRHHWSHPAFAEKAVELSPSQKQLSMKWLEEFATRVELSYHDLLGVLEGYIESGDYHTFGFDTPDICNERPEEMWSHYEIVSGKKVADKEAVPFSCAC